jgi:hypothetical protein
MQPRPAAELGRLQQLLAAQRRAMCCHHAPWMFVSTVISFDIMEGLRGSQLWQNAPAAMCSGVVALPCGVHGNLHQQHCRS